MHIPIRVLFRVPPEEQRDVFVSLWLSNHAGSARRSRSALGASTAEYLSEFLRLGLFAVGQFDLGQLPPLLLYLVFAPQGCLQTLKLG